MTNTKPIELATDEHGLAAAAPEVGGPTSDASTSAASELGCVDILGLANILTATLTD